MSFDETVLCLPEADQKIVKAMMVLLESIDRQTEEFSGRTTLKCKNGCGACCTNPDIETTVAEVLPMAVYLWSSFPSGNPAVENILQVIRSKSSKGVCVFYKPDPTDQTQGRYGIYAFRPGLCRLFGFAARHDKHGRSTLVTCKVIKDSQPQACAQTQEGLQQGALEAPLLSALSMGVSNIDPLNGLKLLPINDAIKAALEKVGYLIEKSKQ